MSRRILAATVAAAARRWPPSRSSQRRSGTPSHTNTLLSEAAAAAQHVRDADRQSVSATDARHDVDVQGQARRRMDFALFMVEALENDELIRETPAIVGRQSPAALAQPRGSE